MVMEKTIEKYAVIRFSCKAGFDATKTLEMIQKIYGESAVHRTTGFRRYNTFQKGVVVSKISLLIDMYRYFQNIDPFFDIFKILIRIKKF